MTSGISTITCEFNKIRAFFNWCRREGYTRNYPFDNFEIAPELYGTPIYITKKERDAIFNADLSSDPQLAVQRDIFIFHSCIGCRVSDLMRMTKSNIVGNSIEYVAGKTFCGNLYRSVKDPDLVGSLSGHAHGSAAFTRYRDIDDDMKQELVRELE